MNVDLKNSKKIDVVIALVIRIATSIIVKSKIPFIIKEKRGINKLM